MELFLGGGARYFFGGRRSVHQVFQEKKGSPKRKFSGQLLPGHLGVIRADIPAQHFGSGRSKSFKNKHLGADIHDPKVRTSTTLRDFQKLRSAKLWAEFSFPSLPHKRRGQKKKVLSKMVPLHASIAVGRRIGGSFGCALLQE